MSPNPNLATASFTLSQRLAPSSSSEHTSATSSVMLSAADHRSSGDGGSGSSDIESDGAPYATVRHDQSERLRIEGSLLEEDEEEDSHYSLVRQPDGRADDPAYSPLK